MPPRRYVYKLTTDNGGAPCVTGNLLSLAICKPDIRRMAQVGDWIYGFGGRDLGARLIYIANVTRRLERGSYYVDDSYGGRGDRIYRRTHGVYEIREGARYHEGGSELEHDLGKPPEYRSAVTILSANFRYLGKNGTSEYRDRIPELAKLLDELKRKHRVNHSGSVTEALERLQESLWKAHPTSMVLGPPSESDRNKVCNRGSAICEC